MQTSEELLDAARTGDSTAFEQLVGPYREQLRAHCYRMLGSLHDADDAVQETLIRAWRSVGRLDDRGFVRAWLYRIATNRCLSALEHRRRRELPVSATGWNSETEICWLEPYPGPSPEAGYVQRETLQLTFVAALQRLTPVQRSVLLLRQVLGFSAAEVGELLDLSAAAVNSALQRARKAVGERPVGADLMSGHAGHDTVARTIAFWVTAWQSGDVDAIVALLTDDARFSMPPQPRWYAGVSEIRAFLVAGPLQYRWRFVSTTANGQPAFGTYRWEDSAGSFVPAGLDVLSIRDGLVAEVTSFLDADFSRFGLPGRIEG